MGKKLRSIILLLVIAVSIFSCGNEKGIKESVAQKTSENKAEEVEVEEIKNYAEMSVEEIVAGLTLDEKAAQMVQGAIYNVDYESMEEFCYGSVLSQSETGLSNEEWQEIVASYQEAAMASSSGIPFLYGNDDVHGVNYCGGAVIFPHNIGIGAANDPELTYQMGLATADEAKLCSMLWNFAPCVAQAVDPRWGRTYESYSTDLDIIKSLSASYSKGLLDGGVVACAKHYFADGNVTYGTGEELDGRKLLDRGDSELSEDEIQELLSVYQTLVDTGVQTIMISHSSLNGVKMHENAEYIQYLKSDMGFKGFVVSDWNSIHNISVSNLKDQVITAVNAGIDMLMEDADYENCRKYIVEAVNEGSISQERLDDAVSRIINVKKDMGLFTDPMLENMVTKQTDVGSEEYRELAMKLVEKSLVLIKNDNDILPFKEGTTIYVTGPAADNTGMQSGGWTVTWTGNYGGESDDKPFVMGATTILEGLNEIAEKYNLTIITDSERADEADVVLLVVGEQTYVEWLGDTSDLELTGELGLGGNKVAISKAEELGIPTITCIVAGRNVIISDYYDSWDAVVMCYLPGSEGKGVANVLCGKAGFSGKLPMPWYSSVDSIDQGEYWLETGFGMVYK